MSTRQATLDTLASALEYMLKALLAQQHRDGFLQGDQLATSSAFSEDTFSLTSHFITALASCGYKNGRYIDKAMRWFLNQQVNGAFNRASMSYLEVLLLLDTSQAVLKDRDAVIEELIKKLLQQRKGNAQYQIEGVNDWFGTLWALKLLTRARQHGYIQSERIRNLIRQDIEGVFTNNSRSGIRRSRHHQELALALRLYYELHEQSLDREQRELLNRLLDSNKPTNGLWNASRSLIQELSTLKRHGFSRDISQDSREKWRQAFVGTTHVIENLGPLQGRFLHVEGALDRAMEALVDIFGSDPGDLLQSFQKNYDWTLIMCRMLVAGETYARGELQSRLLTSLIDQVEIKSNTWDRIEVTNALRNAFQISYKEEPARLTLGLSGAKVLRIKPIISIPPSTSDQDPKALSINGFESVIVKYGPHQDIEAEYYNYRDHLPYTLQPLFASMRLTHRTTDHSFLVMQDLENYVSFEEYLKDARPEDITEHLTDGLIDFVQHLHRPALGRNRQAANGLVRKLYLEPLWRYIETIYSVYREPALQAALTQDNWDEHEKMEETERKLRIIIAKLYMVEKSLGGFPTTYMHGDLHTRNIMLSTNGGQIRFKFIDLEKFMAAGDYVADVGQLFTNLKLLASMEPIKEKRQPINQIATTLVAAYDDIAKGLADVLHPARLPLAEAVAKLRIGNGQAKSARLMSQTRPDTAVKLLQEAIERIEYAQNDLCYALDRLKGLGIKVD